LLIRSEKNRERKPHLRNAHSRAPYSVDDPIGIMGAMNAYPLMFRSTDLVVVNKMDLLEHLDFDLEQCLGNLDAVNPGVKRILTSARTGEGVDEWCAWLGRRGAPSWASSTRRTRGGSSRSASESLHPTTSQAGQHSLRYGYATINRTG